MRNLKEKRVLEIGSRYVSGSARPLIEKFYRPKEYIGVDTEHGKFVDLILSVEDLLDHFGPRSFDVLIAIELLEHVLDWRIALNNMKFMLKSGGYITSQLVLEDSHTTAILTIFGGMK